MTNDRVTKTVSTIAASVILAAISFIFVVVALAAGLRLFDYIAP